MTNYLKVDEKNSRLIKDKTFDKKSRIVGSREYYMLQQAKRDYPSFTVITKSIKKNDTKTTYSGLTYKYMKDYIIRFGTDKTAEVKELEDMIFLSQCHKKSLRYATIKKWFLDKYPEVKEFLKTTEAAEETEKDNTPKLEVAAAAGNDNSVSPNNNIIKKVS